VPHLHKVALLLVHPCEGSPYLEWF
jgi:hypothetical protein